MEFLGFAPFRVSFNMRILFTDEVKSDGGSDLSQQVADDQALSPESPTNEAVKGLADENKDELQTQTPNTKSDVLSASKVEDDKVEAAPEKNDSVTNSDGQTAVPFPNENVTKGLFFL